MVVLIESSIDSAIETLVCHCLAVSQEVICEAVEASGLRSVGEVTACTGAGAGCTACHRRIRKLIDAHRRGTAQSGFAASACATSAFATAS